MRLHNHCLNPYSIGRYSMRTKLWKSRISSIRLNPYSNGIWSTRLCRISLKRWKSFVLILILMEYDLRALIARAEVVPSEYVLILILMEYDLRVQRDKWLCQGWESLNPYSNGIYSMRRSQRWRQIPAVRVLILILMDMPYGVRILQLFRSSTILILILMEYAHWDAGAMPFEFYCMS